jgi:peptidyl-prolyl cis-trans isomerase B (cyclophilin B)
MAKQAIFETTKGTITIELFNQEAPNTVEKLQRLATKGIMVQGGDPTGTGTGGPGYEIECEIHPSRNHAKGSLSMAHKGQCKHDPKTGKKITGRCTGGSQFFITHRATGHLDGVHTVFGQVTSGQEIVDKIQQGDKMTKVTVTAAKK